MVGTGVDEDRGRDTNRMEGDGVPVLPSECTGIEYDGTHCVCVVHKPRADNRIREASAGYLEKTETMADEHESWQDTPTTYARMC